MTVVLFWLSTLLVVYVYAFYPTLMWLIARWKRQSSEQAVPSSYTPSVRVIVAAHNEERVIARRIENLLRQDYPKELLSITICSDGSSDRTVAVASTYEEQNVTVLAFDVQRGRHACHNDALRLAHEDVLVFTDAETQFDHQFIRQIVAPFVDEHVGCVCGRLEYVNPRLSSVTQSQGLYWRVERWMREGESAVGCLAMASGACMAVRRTLMRPIRPAIDVDVATPIDVVNAGFRVVYAIRAEAFDRMPASPSEEFRARIRIVSKAFPYLLRNLAAPAMLRRPGIVLALLSHKILRYCTPLLLTSSLGANLMLISEATCYRAAAVLQLCLYGAGLVGWLAEKWSRRIPFADNAFSFLLTNLAFFIGLAKGISGRATVMYRPAETGE